MSYYLSEESNIELFQDQTGMALDEIESLVGRFTKHSSRAGLLRGEVVVDKFAGIIKLRHHFTKRVLWQGEII